MERQGFIDGVDPKLEDLEQKVRALLTEAEVAGAFQLASSTHGQFGFQVPGWSAIFMDADPEGKPAIRIRSSSERDGKTHLECSVHLWLSLRDMMMHQAAFFMQAGRMIERGLKQSGIELEHVSLQEKLRLDAGGANGSCDG